QLGFYSDNIDQATADAYARAGGGAGGPSGGFPGGQPTGAGGQGANFDFGGFDFTDLFEGGGGRGRKSASAGSGGFKDIFSGMFGGRGTSAHEGPEPGSDLEYQVNVPFWTAIRGGVMKLNITRRVVCGPCHGKGYIESPGTC